MQRTPHEMYRRKNCGLTLIELLIATVLSSLILLTAYSLLNYQQHYFQKHQQQIQVEQNKRFAQFILSQTIWQAGFLGCRSLSTSQLDNHLTNNNFISQQKPIVAIFAYQAIGNSWRPALPTGINAKPGTDVLQLVYMQPHNTALSVAMTNPAEAITVNNASLFKPNDRVIISDCEQADLFTISKINGSKKQLLHSISLSKAYVLPSEIGELSYILFYIQPKDPDDKNSDAALYMLDQSNLAEELITNVTGLHFLFATQNAPRNYVTANAINDWSQVHSVEIKLSLSAGHQKSESYSFITSLRNQ